MNDSQDGLIDKVTQHLAPPLWRRMACWVYEGLLLFGVVFVTTLVYTMITTQMGAPNEDLAQSASDHRQGVQALLLVILTSYFVYFWRLGQTLAMKTWHIQLRNLQNEAPSTRQCLWRWFLSWVWFAPPLALSMPLHLGGADLSVLILGWTAIWAILSRFHSHGQFWHDAWAQTQLIHAPRISKNAQGPTTAA